jgi:AcrR family transcriptional regulator
MRLEEVLPVTTRVEKKAATRAAILDAATSLFAERGFSAVTTAEIAASAEISHGLIFAHFTTRDDLVIAVTGRFGQLLGKRLHDLAERQVSLRAVLEAHLQTIGEHEQLYSRLVDEFRLLPAAAQDHFVSLQSVLSHHLYQVARREMQCGVIIPVENDLFFNTWTGLLHYYLTNRRLFTNGDSILGSVGERLLHHFLRLVAKKGG